MTALLRQTQIYLGGISGRRPRVPIDAARLEQRARRRMSADAFAYVAAGAGNERTLAANRAAFDRWRIVPRMLRDVERRDTGVELFGRRLESPFLLAPIGVLELAHPEADVAVARAARDTGAPMIFSNQASRPMEALAGILGESPHWFQLYWSKSDDLVESLARRAKACGCEAIVVTLDTTVLGWRTRDLERAYLPFLRGKGIAQYTSDPAFGRLIASPGTPPPPEQQPRPNLHALRTLIALTRAYPGGFLDTLRSGRGRAAVQRFIEIYSRPSLRWEDLPFLRERTDLPILLKGILHPGDATRAVEEGIDGIVVSNHGGRQVDGAIATLEALPEVARAVDGRIPILLDSGIRGGADAFKALALGASAVLIGRAWAWAVAARGEAGVRHVLEVLKADIDVALALTGQTSFAGLDSSALYHAGSAVAP
jgi:isopentenyl diphosphate isomerase/L-lactate dehydrogenase-like FMN-dependent dehydrogenase